MTNDRYLTIGILAWVAIILLSIQIWWSWPDELVHLVMCDVGQGDAILLTQSSFQILIDQGPNHDQVLLCLRRHLPWWDRRLEIVVGSHADADHVGGLAAVLDRYAVSELWLSPWGKDTSDFATLEQSVSRKIKQGTQLRLPKPGETWLITPQLRVTSLSPRVGVEEVRQFFAQFSETILSATNHPSDDDPVIPVDYNQGSIVLRIDCGQIGMLLTADIDETVEAALLEIGLIGPTQILKVAHHGAKTSTSPEWLNRVQPEISLISSGFNNRYGHPHQEVINRLQQIGSQIWRTDQLGEVEIECDGSRWWLK